jgi:hypothetical protein
MRHGSYRDGLLPRGEMHLPWHFTGSDVKSGEFVREVDLTDSLLEVTNLDHGRVHIDEMIPRYFHVDSLQAG